MADTKKTKKVESWKTKKWFSIIAPRVLRNVMVGETLALSADETIGRTVTLSLMALVGDMKKQNTNVTLTINRIQDGKAMSELTGYELMPSAVKRFVRRGRDRIDDSFTVTTGDELTVQLKTLAITKGKTTGSKITLLRKLSRSTIKEYAKKVTYEELLNDLLGNKIQRGAGETLSKVYPLRNFEVRSFQLLTKLGTSSLENRKVVSNDEKKEEPAKETEASEEIKEETEQQKAEE